MHEPGITVLNIVSVAQHLSQTRYMFLPGAYLTKVFQQRVVSITFDIYFFIQNKMENKINDLNYMVKAENI